MKFIKEHISPMMLLIWLIITPILIFIPYQIYTQGAPENNDNEEGFGIWTYGKPLDPEYSSYIDNDTLDILSAANVYFVFRVRRTKIDDLVIGNITRLRDHGIDVHIWINPTTEGDKFINVWTFENVIADMEYCLEYLNNESLIGNPITKVVYDMEPITGQTFPFYNFDREYISKLREFYEIQSLFNEFNQWIRDTYGLDIRICSDLYQGFDFKDGDDDMTAVCGLLNDYHPSTTMSYMIYRRDNLELNYILDTCRYLNDGDTFILNSWKEEGFMCWEDLNCAIKESRLVLGYPKKNFNLEIWCLYYFLKSYGVDGLIEYTNAISNDWTTWDDISVIYQWWFSPWSDLIFTSVSIFDWYGPLIRALYFLFTINT
ncbi:MAG: hypothetical protein GF364_05140 [Candidatus Lokiarchaeota archaeon]|nr:hypothetical protein [Candidatus Lokiarchaeota archaeon]